MTEEKVLLPVPIEEKPLAKVPEPASPIVPVDPAEDVPKKKKKGSGFVVAILVLALALVLIGKFANRTVSLEDEMEKHAKDKYEQLGVDKVFKVHGSSSMYGVTVRVSQISFRENETLLWTEIENDTGTPLYGLPGIKAQLVDEDGRVYTVDAFSGTDELQGPIPAKSKVEAILSFPVVKASSRELSLKLPGMFTMDTKDNVRADMAVRFRIP